MHNFLNTKFVNEIKIKLDKIVQKKGMSNAYIFYGPENIGKKEMALRFIAEIIKNNNSDLEAYAKIKENNYPDFLKIEPTYISKGNLINKSQRDKDTNHNIKSIIRIEQIRNIRVFLSKKSIQSEKKFILIDDAHLLNESSSNCLLKTLEEPTNGVFILLTSRFNLLLETIISRCQTIRFKHYADHQLKLVLEKSKDYNSSEFLDNTILETLIFISNGSPGKLLKNVAIWNQIPDKIKNDSNFPLQNFDNILFLAKHITTDLDLCQQELLIDYMQRSYWTKTKNKKTSEILEGIKKNINSNVQPRISWEVGLLKIKLQES